MPEQTVSSCQRCQTNNSEALRIAQAGRLALLCALSILALLLLWRPPTARAVEAALPVDDPTDESGPTAVITVTTVADAVNGSLASIPALLASPGPDGVSLREALLVGNAEPVTTTVRVTFAIAGCADECVILLPDTPLPALARGAIIIDGGTQLRPDGSPQIVLDGFYLFAPDGENIGLLITSADNRVLSIGVRNFYDRALALRGPAAAHNVVQGSVLGSDGATTPDPSSAIAVEISGGAYDNLIGGSTQGQGNTISGSFSSNVQITDAETRDNRLQGNLIGTTRSGTAPIAAFGGSTTARGVEVIGAARTLIGGDTPGDGNTISGNATGVWIEGTLSTTVSANMLGLDGAGAAPLPNTDYGVLVIGGARATLIGGASSGSRNVISSNGTLPGPLSPYGYGVAIQGAGTVDTVVQGNIIGLDITGTQPRGNLRQGVLVADGAVRTLIGGESPDAGNLIADNGRGGIRATAPVTISGNLIGFAIDGVAARGNQLSGVRIDGVDSLVGPGNRIGNSAQDGVTISGARATVRDNTIVANANAGIQASGESPAISDNDLRANRRTGALLFGTGASVRDNVLAQNGTDSSDVAHVGVFISGTLSLVISNTISANAYAGITVAEGDGNQLSQNSISSNGTTGIALVLGGNAQIASPTLVSLASMRVEGRSCATCRIEIFSDDGGQGRIYEGSVVADAAGIFVFEALEALRGPYITATATDAARNTSPFAPPVRLPSPAPDPTSTSVPPTPTPPTPPSTPGPLPGRHFRVLLPVVMRP